MLDLRERIEKSMHVHGCLTFRALTELFPVQSVVHLAEVLHDMIQDGILNKKIDPNSGQTWYFRRYYTESSSHMIFHYLDHPHPERFFVVPLVQEMPWFYEPIEYDLDLIHSPNFADHKAALAAAELAEKEQLV